MHFIFFVKQKARNQQLEIRYCSLVTKRKHACRSHVS